MRFHEERPVPTSRVNAQSIKLGLDFRIPSYSPRLVASIPVDAFDGEFPRDLLENFQRIALRNAESAVKPPVKLPQAFAQPPPAGGPESQACAKVNFLRIRGRFILRIPARVRASLRLSVLTEVSRMRICGCFPANRRLRAQRSFEPALRLNGFCFQPA